MVQSDWGLSMIFVGRSSFVQTLLFVLVHVFNKRFQQSSSTNNRQEANVLGIDSVGGRADQINTKYTMSSYKVVNYSSTAKQSRVFRWLTRIFMRHQAHNPESKYQVAERNSTRRLEKTPPACRITSAAAVATRMGVQHDDE